MGGTAAVYAIGPEGTKLIWRARSGIGNVQVYVPHMSERWEVEYTDAERLYGNLPHARVLDVYRINYNERTFRRAVHVALD